MDAPPYPPKNAVTKMYHDEAVYGLHPVGCGRLSILAGS